MRDVQVSDFLSLLVRRSKTTRDCRGLSDRGITAPRSTSSTSQRLQPPRYVRAPGGHSIDLLVQPPQPSPLSSSPQAMGRSCRVGLGTITIDGGVAALHETRGPGQVNWRARSNARTAGSNTAEARTPLPEAPEAAVVTTGLQRLDSKARCRRFRRRRRGQWQLEPWHNNTPSLSGDGGPAARCSGSASGCSERGEGEGASDKAANNTATRAQQQSRAQAPAFGSKTASEATLADCGPRSARPHMGSGRGSRRLKRRRPSGSEATGLAAMASTLLVPEQVTEAPSARPAQPVVTEETGSKEGAASKEDEKDPCDNCSGGVAGVESMQAGVKRRTTGHHHGPTPHEVRAALLQKWAFFVMVRARLPCAPVTLQ